MTRRQLGRRVRRHPILAAVVVALVVVVGIADHLGALVLIAAAAAGAYALGRRERGGAAGQLATLAAERDQLGAEVGDLRRQLADARAAARGPANARSLAQLNRHLNGRLDALEVKLEAEMNRADRAEESARAAWDAADELLGAAPGVHPLGCR